MDWRDKDYQSPAQKKAPTLIDKAYYFRTTDRHECPVQRSLNSYSYYNSGKDKLKRMLFDMKDPAKRFIVESSIASKLPK